MSSSLLFLSGQISVMETKLLSPSQLDRMIGAKSTDDAFAVLAELQYAAYFDEALRASSFTKVLGQGLKETRDFLNESLDHPNHRMMLWLKYDLNNLKRAAKDRFLFGEESLNDFTEDNGYIPLGNLDLAELQSVIYDGASHPLLPESLVEAIRAFGEQEGNAIRDLDEALDEAYLQAFAKLSRNLGEGLQSYAKAQIDLYNLRRVLRSVTTLGSSDTPWTKGGTLDADDFSGASDVESFAQSLGRTPYTSLLQPFAAQAPVEQQLHQFETLCDRELEDLLKDLGATNDGLAKALYYFDRRWHNARMIKVVMFGKFYNLEPVVIEEKLKNLVS